MRATVLVAALVLLTCVMAQNTTSNVTTTAAPSTTTTTAPTTTTAAPTSAPKGTAPGNTTTAAPTAAPQGTVTINITVNGTVVYAIVSTTTLSGSQWASIVNNPTAFAALKISLANDLAQLLGIPAQYIQIISAVVASLVINYGVVTGSGVSVATLLTAANSAANSTSWLTSTKAAYAAVSNETLTVTSVTAGTPAPAVGPTTTTAGTSAPTVAATPAPTHTSSAVTIPFACASVAAALASLLLL